MEITEHTVIQQLEDLGEACLKLAKQLSKTGRPLNSREASLVRHALFGWVEEILEEIKIGYFTGRGDRVTESLDRVNEITQHVNQMTS